MLSAGRLKTSNISIFATDNTYFKHCDHLDEENGYVPCSVDVVQFCYVIVLEDFELPYW